MVKKKMQGGTINTFNPLHLCSISPSRCSNWQIASNASREDELVEKLVISITPPIETAD